jgi:hypothetical protein
MISIFSAFKNGLLNAWNERKMLFWLYGFNFIFAYLLTLPILMMLSNALDGTTAAEKVLQAFDLTIFRTIIAEYGSGLTFSRLLITIGLFYFVLNIFFAGGVLKVFVEEKRFQLSDFFSGCVEYFYRFFKLFLISLLFLVGVFMVNLLLSNLSGLLTDNATAEHTGILLFFIRMGIVVFLLALTNMIFDYAKIMIVVNDYYDMIKAVKLTFMFVMMSLFKTVGLYALYFLTAVIIACIYLLIASLIDISNGFMVLIFFILSQVYMIAKIWIRISFFAGQYSFYHYSNAAMPGMTKEMLDEAVENYEKRQMI